MVQSADFTVVRFLRHGRDHRALERVYDVKETRAWWRRTLLAILLTIALAVLIITALALMFDGSRIAEAIANHLRLRLSFNLFMKWVRYTRRSTSESGNPLRPAAAFRQACRDVLPALE